MKNKLPIILAVTAALAAAAAGMYTARQQAIRTDPASDAGYEFTSQLFFDEVMSDAIYTAKTYSSKDQRTKLNAIDGIYATDGEQLTLNVVENDDTSVGGYKATFYIALDLSQSAAETGMTGGSADARGGGPGGTPPSGTHPSGTPPSTPNG